MAACGVQLSCNGELWLISRRFSDFDQLHSRLTRRFGDLIEVGLPEKQWFGRYCVCGCLNEDARNSMMKRMRPDVRMPVTWCREASYVRVLS